MHQRTRIKLSLSLTSLHYPLFAVLTLVGTLLFSVSASAEPTAPYQATGFKIGEVTDHSAIVWTRLTRGPTRNPISRPMVEVKPATKKEVDDKDQRGGKGKHSEKNERKRKSRLTRVVYPKGITVADIRDAAPGTPGETRVHYKPRSAAAWKTTRWTAVDPSRDFTRQLQLSNLRANTHYVVRVESRAPHGGPVGATLYGGFRTAPAAHDPAPVQFAVSTGQAYRDRDGPDGFKIYRSMLTLDPSFFVHTGDIVYYDKLAKTEELARYHWQRTYGLPSNVDFHRQVTSYFEKDDHDTWVNDSWPTMDDRDFMHPFTFTQGQAIFREQVPMGRKTYRTYRWGKDLQIWLVEGRDYRTPNNMRDGPDKTIWGVEQKAWFKQTVRKSDAAFRILISPTPIVGPDRSAKNDNHSNKGFAHEGDELRTFIASQTNMVVICGDRHWQYHSIHPDTGVREYSCGPASDKHAGGWKQSNWVPDYHRYLNVIGGFLSAEVKRVDATPQLTIKYHDVNGKVRYEDQLHAW